MAINVAVESPPHLFELARDSIGRFYSELLKRLLCRIVRRHGERNSAGGTPAYRQAGQPARHKTACRRHSYTYYLKLSFFVVANNRRSRGLHYSRLREVLLHRADQRRKSVGIMHRHVR